MLFVYIHITYNKKKTADHAMTSKRLDKEEKPLYYKWINAVIMVN